MAKTGGTSAAILNWPDSDSPLRLKQPQVKDFSVFLEKIDEHGVEMPGSLDLAGGMSSSDAVTIKGIKGHMKRFASLRSPKLLTFYGSDLQEHESVAHDSCTHNLAHTTICAGNVVCCANRCVFASGVHCRKGVGVVHWPMLPWRAIVL
jgi:hypothetical protein